MAAFTKFQQFVEDLARGVHNLHTDTMGIALCTHANIPVVTNGVLADLTEISYTNLSSRAITPTSAIQTTGTLKLLLPDLLLTASGAVATFRHVVLYNDGPSSPLDPLIGWYDYGSDVTLANTETFNIDFDGSAGVLTLV